MPVMSAAAMLSDEVEVVAQIAPVKYNKSP